VTELRDRADAAAQVLVDDLDVPVVADGDDHHLRRVLRLRDGEVVVAGDGRGGWRRCAVAPSGLEPLEEPHRDAREHTPVAVWLPALKGDRSEWAVQKLTELGVDEIGLLRCARGTVRLDEPTAARVLARWARVAREAACQSRRTWLPVLVGPRDVAQVVTAGAARCDLEGTAPLAAALCVGPEGGWDDVERPGDAAAVSLADAVLRTETAAVVAGVRLVTSRRTARHDAAVDAP
jgi:16S rRNA (uracil1498-N3)-methyltransferase